MFAPKEKNRKDNLNMSFESSRFYTAAAYDVTPALYGRM